MPCETSADAFTRLHKKWCNVPVVTFQEQYDKAVKYFEKAVKYGDWQAMFQLGVIHYDGLAGTADHVRFIFLAQTLSGNLVTIVKSKL